MDGEITILATLAGVNTAARPISFGIDGDAKISLESDASQKMQVVTLLALDKTLLEVTFRPVPGAVPEKKGRKRKDSIVDAEMIQGEFEVE